MITELHLDIVFLEKTAVMEVGKGERKHSGSKQCVSGILVRKLRTQLTKKKKKKNSTNTGDRRR
jgi:hypothetical protein